MISFNCPGCQMKLTVKPEYAGRSAKCPTCKKPLNVPSLDKTQAYVPPQQIDGEESSLAKIGHDGGVTLDNDPGRRMPNTLPGQKPLRSVGEVLAGRKKTNERYVIEGEIARGGMGAVLRAVDCDLRREVAVKFMLDEKDPKKKARFIEEAQITGQLEHPNIVPIHDLGVDSRGRLYFSMKMVKGRTLAQVLDDLRKNPKQADKEYSLGRLLNVLVNVCNALAYAHSRGVVNRDLKPGNVMVGEFGEVYLMDWGLAKVLKSDGVARLESGPPIPGSESVAPGRSSKVVTNREPEADLTQEGSIVGTPVYMPPEQASGNLQAIDQRSDVYALGAILYEMLTLAAPIDKDGGYMAILMRVVQGEIVPPAQRAPQRAKAGKIPQELSAIAMKALATDKAKRYPNVEALRRDIERYQEGRTVSAKEYTTKEMVWKLVKRNKAVSAALVVLLPAIAVLLSFALTNHWAYVREHSEKERRTQDAVPALVVAAKVVANEGKFEEALKQIAVVLDYDAANAEVRLLRGQIWIAQKNWQEARGELAEYLRLRPTDTEAKRLAELCDPGKMDDPVTVLAVVDVLQRQRATGPAAPLVLDLQRRVSARQALVALYRKQLDSAQPPGLGSCLGLSKDAKIVVGLYGRKDVADLKPFQGMLLDRMDLMGCSQIVDLAPLRGMPLTSLRLAGLSQVKDITSLRGMPLIELDLDGCTKIADFTPLQGLPLTALTINFCSQISDVAPLQGMKLAKLHMRACRQIRDLTPLRGMPLKELFLMDCHQVQDLTPLQGAPVTTLHLGGCNQVQDLTPLRGMPLTSLNIWICSQVQDLTPLRGMPLETLNLRGCVQVPDLAPLQKMPLKNLYLGNCRLVKDLTPLQDCPLESLDIQDCGQVRDLTPLAGMSLTSVLLTPKHITKGMKVLRDMKSLKTIGTGPSNTFAPAEFWKRYDAGEFK